MSRRRTPLKEQCRLVMECRQSGLSDALWCQQNDIRPGTFYNWTARLRQRGCELPDSVSQDDFIPSPRQDVVKVDLVADSYNASSANETIVFDSSIPTSSTLTLEMNGARLEIPQGTDLSFLSQVIQILRGTSC